MTETSIEVDCSATKMIYEGPGKKCNNTREWSGALGNRGYGSAPECFEQCQLDASCQASQFYIHSRTGGISCPAGMPLEQCGPRCSLVDECGTISNNDNSGNVNLPADMYHVAVKAPKTAAEVGGDFACSRLDPPRPSFAHERDGLVAVQMDSPVEPPVGVATGAAFDCQHVLASRSRVAVGGAGAVCRWGTSTTLFITLGPWATLGRPDGFDNYGQIFGDAAVLAFRASKLRPRGLFVNYWPADAGEEVSVFVRRTRPYSLRDGGKQQLPRVVLRGPESLGGCGRLEVLADTSTFGRGRRWRSANWTCLETQPDARLTPGGDEWFAAYEACSERIQPILDARAWCDDTVLGAAEAKEAGVVRLCELRVVIPQESWCGLGLIRIGLTLKSAEGLATFAEWTTELEPLLQVPTVGAVSPRTVNVSPQRQPGAPLPRLTLEITTRSDTVPGGRCACGFNSSLPEDGSGDRVLVEWHYGEIKDGPELRQYELQPVVGDESATPNLLVLPLTGELLRPLSKWRFVARAAFAAAADQGASVTFTLEVGPVEPPQVVLKAPYRINGQWCSFKVDASGSMVREMLYWQGRRLEADSNTSTPSITKAAASPPNSKTSLAASDARHLADARVQALSFQWECRQFAAGIDDAGSFTVTPIFSTLARICSSTDPVLNVDMMLLPAGLYMFTVVVTDDAFPDTVARKNVTVEVVDDIFPGFNIAGPPSLIPLGHPASITFTQVGFSSCPTPVTYGGAVMLLMRTMSGLPPSSMQAVAELEVARSVTSIDGLKSLVMTATAAANLLEPGFDYSIRLLSTMARPTQLANYKTSLLAATIGTEPSPTERVVKREPIRPPDSVWVTDSEPFAVHAGPTAGSLELIAPANGLGWAMQTLFQFQQLWATDDPPLEYAYYYGLVPEARAADFESELARGNMDGFATERLLALIPEGSLTVLSSWTLDPTLSSPLPIGRYVIAGKSRDAHGVESTRAVAVKSIEPWKPAMSSLATTTNEKLMYLETYVSTSTYAISQVRATNKGAVAVMPVTSAVDSMPDLSYYDFGSMKDWAPSLGVPNPMLRQRVYGVPIVPQALRAKVVQYLRGLMNTMRDIVKDLDENALRLGGGSGVARRRLQDQGASTHVQALSKSFRQLAIAIEPVLEHDLYPKLAELVNLLLTRLHLAYVPLSDHAGSDQDLLAAFAALLAGAEPAPIPRAGIIRPNISANVQTRLAAEVMEGLGRLGDALSAPLALDTLLEISASLPASASPRTLGEPLRLSVKPMSLDSVISSGVTLTPDFQSIDRWPYPRVALGALGPPGFLAENWAGAYADSAKSRYSAAQCFSSSEVFLDRIVLLLISWPISPALYASGSLVGATTNATMPYTVALRSCGEAIAVDGLVGQVQLTFRLEPSTVRKRRWGYDDLAPYRVVWWEDIPGIGVQASRIRRWSTQGCRTEWEKTQEDVVKAKCDRTPGASPGSIFAVELVPRPLYELDPPPWENASFHNAATYWVVLLLLRWCFIFWSARRADREFWPTEKHMMKIYFVPAEHRWEQAVRSGRVNQHYLLQDPGQGILRGGLNAVVESMVSMKNSVTDLAVSLATLSGSESRKSLEIRELACMRSGKRSEVYEHFFDAADAQDVERRLNTILAATTARATPVMPSLEDFPAPTSSGGVRRAAWQDATEPVQAKPPKDVGAARKPVLGDLAEVEDIPDDHFQTLADSGLADTRDTASALRTALSPSAGRVSGTAGTSTGFKSASIIADAATANMPSQASLGGAPRPPPNRPNSDGPPLPPGWSEAWSEEEQAFYYYYPATGDVTWERPLAKKRPNGKLGSLRAAAQPTPQIESPSRFGHMFDDESESPSGSKMFQPEAAHGAPPSMEAQQLRHAANSSFDAGGLPGQPPDAFRDDEGDRLAPRRAAALRLADPQHGAAALLDAPEDRSDDSAPPSRVSTARDTSSARNDPLRRRVEQSMQAAQDSRQATLATGWDLHRTSEGVDFYVNVRAGLTQWEVPQLPPHWEERRSTDGQVYYLSLFDGRTQWEWPSEVGNTLELRREALTANSTLALPGSLQAGEDFDPDIRSENSGESIAAAADMLDANALLAMPMERPRSAGSSIASGRSVIAAAPGTTGAVEETKIEKWGDDKQEEQWNEFKKKLDVQRRSHDSRYATALDYPGLREFVRPHELTDQTNNWDRQANNIVMKRDAYVRSKMQMGHQAEIGKKELRNIFPVIQRLQWTKWGAGEIFFRCFLRAMPNYRVFLNIAPPTKTHRCLSHIFFAAVLLLTSTLMLSSESLLSEDIRASEQAVWTLLAQMFTGPWEIASFSVAAFAALLGHTVKWGCDALFFAHRVPGNRPPPQAPEARREQMRYWHELEVMGKWVCVLGSFVAVGGTLTLCAWQPQPRGTYVMRTFLLAVVYTHVGLPLLRAISSTLILTSARSGGAFDGFLSVFPGVMDFLSVGVVTPAFLSWRVQRIVAEEQMLRKVHHTKKEPKYNPGKALAPQPATNGPPQSAAQSGSGAPQGLEDK